MFETDKQKLDKFMAEVIELAYEIAPKAMTPEQFGAVWRLIKRVEDELREQMAAADDRYVICEENTQLRNELARTERQLDNYIRWYEDAKNATNFQEELGDLRKALDEARRERDDALNRLGDLQVKYDEMKSSRDRALAGLEEANDAVEYYKGLRDAAEDEVRRLRDELDDRTLLTEACRASRIERGVRALVDYAFTRATSAAADGDDDVYRAYDDMQLRLEDVLRLDDYTDPDSVIAKLTE